MWKEGPGVWNLKADACKVPPTSPHSFPQVSIPPCMKNRKLLMFAEFWSITFGLFFGMPEIVQGMPSWLIQKPSKVGQNEVWGNPRPLPPAQGGFV